MENQRSSSTNDRLESDPGLLAHGTPVCNSDAAGLEIGPQGHFKRPTSRRSCCGTWVKNLTLSP